MAAETQPRRALESSPPRRAGFTLIELLIVLAVLVLLSTVAVSSYRSYVLQSGRAEALGALKELAQRQEEYFSDRQSYTGSLSTLNYPTTTANGLYQLQLSTSTTVDYSIQATAINQQLDDEKCRTFTLNGLGSRGAVDAGGDDATQACWDR